ncbi:TPA: hypothetical protein N0F65_012209 [Lagenidium giganteum]|uniref:Uncharacterized protein n=1 Tax=Lagenidium giganteum TaxID=4803 RepID=A0AAV2ZEI7_9STRA|nr:TPA: hypothetical protein N0F65_012209 [Lagenidium giganteum]
MIFQRVFAVVCLSATVLLTANVARAAEWTKEPLEFKKQECCSKAPTDQVCFFEEANYKGKCACIGVTPDYEDVALGNGGGYGSVRVPTDRKLVINVFNDDYIRNNTSIESCRTTGGIARRFVVGTRCTVCLYDQVNFHGEKVCLSADSKPYKHPRGFQSVLFFPTTGSGLRADIKGDRCRTESTRSFGELPAEWTKSEIKEPLDFKQQECCSEAPTDQVCFFEEANYKGKCACIGVTPDYEDVRLGNGGGYGSVRVPTDRKLVINVFNDDYIRNTTSIQDCRPTGGIARRFVVGTRSTVCLYEQVSFHGEKVCLPADGKPYKHASGFQSVLFFPTTSSGLRADVKDDTCRTKSTHIFGELPSQWTKHEVTISKL